jgi:hypothetical protein
MPKRAKRLISTGVVVLLVAVVNIAVAEPQSTCSGVTVRPGANLQRVFDAHDSGTTFCFRPGTYALSSFVVPKSNDRLISVVPRGAILTGGGRRTGGIASYGRSGVLVKGFVVTRFVHGSSFPNAAIAAGPGWKVVNNEISHNSQSGVDVNNGVVLRGNFIHHNGRYGFVGGPLRSLLVENNIVSWNNTRHHDPNHDAGGSKIIKSSHLTFRGNKVHHNYGPGLWCDTENVHVLYEKNTLAHNAGPGIFHEASGKAIIRNNTFRRNATLTAHKSVWWGADLYLNDSKNTSIYGNSITSARNGIGLVDVDRGSSAYGKLEIRNVNVHDNTIRIPAGGSNGLVGNRSEAFTDANNRFARNAYFVTDPGADHWEWRGSRTWTEWRALGHDTNGAVRQIAG